MAGDEKEQLTVLAATDASPVTAVELRATIVLFEAFADLPDAVYEALAGIADRVFVPAGQRIYSEGAAVDAAYIIEQGRCRMIFSRRGKSIVADLGRGDVTGLNMVLRQEPSAGDLYALRDTQLIRLKGSELLSCMAANPPLIVAYSRYMADAFLRTHGLRAPSSRPRVFTFFPVSDDPGIRGAADSLLEALGRTHGSGSLVDRTRLRELMGREPAAADDLDRQRVIRWCTEEEAAGRFLLFVCDPTETAWTRWCLEQTDLVVVGARMRDVKEIQRIDGIFAGRSVAREPLQVELLLVHDQNTELPRGTRAWMDLRCRRRHHHVRGGNGADFQRAARLMSDRAVGVVLGGGGARALAHIGVLRALEEAGVPVDVIGGTSMGSVMAAAYAQGWPPQQILETMREAVPNSKALTDPDFPMISFLSGRKLKGVLEFGFGGHDIEDLWVPYYCISASLTEARMVVHDRGPLARSVQASCSLPGIYPPVHADGQLLVDGGIMNNIPVDVMGSMCSGGSVIAVAVGSGGGQNLELGAARNSTGWGLLRNRLNPLSENERVASIVQVLTWSTTLSGTQYVKELIDEGYVDLFLAPPVQEFELLGFHAHQELYDIGYEYTRKRLSEWEGLKDVVPR